MGSNEMLRAGLDTGCAVSCGTDVFGQPTYRMQRPYFRSDRLSHKGSLGAYLCVSFHAAAALASVLLLAACSQTPVVTAVDTYCTRVERFHATEAERETLKANSTALERLIRWVAGINKQFDDNCLKPVAGP